MADLHIRGMTHALAVALCHPPVSVLASGHQDARREASKTLACASSSDRDSPHHTLSNRPSPSSSTSLRRRPHRTQSPPGSSNLTAGALRHLPRAEAAPRPPASQPTVPVCVCPGVTVHARRGLPRSHAKREARSTPADQD